MRSGSLPACAPHQPHGLSRLFPGLSPKLLAGVSRWLAAALLAFGVASPAYAVYIQRYSANANGAITLGCEASCLLSDKLRVSLGWNVFGFTDRARDLTAQDQTQRGVYLRLRFKFDEALF